MPSTSQKFDRRPPQSSSRKRQILDAALHCFNQHGLVGMTLEHIRDHSGASTGSIYHLFAGKQEIAAALYLDLLTDFQQSHLHELTRHRSAHRGITAAVRHYLDWIAANPPGARYLLDTGQAAFLDTIRAPIARHNQNFFGTLADWVAQHVADGHLASLPPKVMLALTVGPAKEFARHWLAGGTPQEMKRARAFLPRAAWLAVAPHE